MESKSASEIEAITKELKSQILSDLTLLVNSNSYSENSQGLIKTGDLICRIAEDKGIEFKKIFFKDQPKGPFHLLAEMSNGKPFIGLIGHFDTVHPPDSPFKILEHKGNTLTGPGVLDMKAGIICAIYGLYIAKRVAGRDFPLKIIFNADEETGSIDSRPLIEKTMKNAKNALIFEGHKFSEHALITSRKGIMQGEMTIKGKAAHAGEEPQSGASAILEAIQKINALDKLNDPTNGIIVTTGRIEGGRVANQIPDYCTSSIDIRFTRQNQESPLQTAIHKIMEHEHVPGCTTRYSLITSRPPFEQTDASTTLFNKYNEAASAFGLHYHQSHRGGGSDGNLTAAIGIPTLDGIGATGDFPHTNSEYIDTKAFFKAINIFALYLTQTKKHTNLEGDDDE